MTEISGPLDLIVATPFDQDSPATRKGNIYGWQASIGEWMVKDGVLHGDEVAEDKHASSCTYRVEATDLGISARFRLGGAGHVIEARHERFADAKGIIALIVKGQGGSVQRRHDLESRKREGRSIK